MKRIQAHSGMTDIGMSVTSFPRPSDSRSSWGVAAMPGEPHIYLAVSQPGNSTTFSRR